MNRRGLLALWFGLALSATIPKAAVAEPVAIPAHDGFALAGDFQGLAGAKAGVLLIHQCNMDRRSWSMLIPKLTAAGIATLSFDLRGKGDSRFDGDAFPHFPADTRSALAHLRDHLAPGAPIGLIGASCGGNQAFLAAPDHAEVKALVILSSRLSPSEPAWAALARRPDIAVLGIGAEGDGQTVPHARRAVEVSASSLNRLIAYPGALHGVPLFEQDPLLVDTIADWVSARLTE